MKVEIKERLLSSGNRSLYLEYYERGFRKKETLGLYLLPDTATGARKHNKAVYEQALEIRSQRILHPIEFKDEQKGKEGKEESLCQMADEPCATKPMTWLEWCDQYVEWSIGCGNVASQIDHKRLVRKRISKYLTITKERELLLKDVTTKHISGLYSFMRHKHYNHQAKNSGGRLSEFSLLLFGETVNAIFNKAVRDNLIPFNPVAGLSSLEKFHVPDNHREFLTAEELQRFLSVKAETESEWQVQHAFGFSCMTGLRRSDIFNLKWADIKPISGTMSVSIIQQKTKDLVTIPLNDMALSLLPEKKEDRQDDYVFHIPRGHDRLTTYIKRVQEKAGIKGKQLSYHCSRHTAATLAITAGAELYSVSKILGHKSIESTQVYADVVMDTKIEAMNLVNGVF